MRVNFAEQSTGEHEPALHVAIIMDGNGRWAKARHLPRLAGHRRGADAVRSTIEAAAELGLDTLTLFAFSADNHHRPADEVAGLMQLLRTYLKRETQKCVDEGIRISVIGRRDRLAPEIVALIERAEQRTVGGRRLHLRIAIDYSGREAMAAAARLARAEPDLSTGRLRELLDQAIHSPPSPDVDLLIRTSGEQRLSDFLLWECAYAEMLFLETLWPDFNGQHLRDALRSFTQRHRRFGRVAQS